MSRAVWVLVVVGLAGTPLLAQGAREWQLQGVLATAPTWFAGGGAGVALRTAGRTRVGAGLSVGSWDRELAARGELLVSYHVNPYARGLAPYAGGGIAVQWRRATRREYMVLVIGIELNPRGGFGWFAEAGLGGGVRSSVGLRWRRSRSR